MSNAFTTAQIEAIAQHLPSFAEFKSQALASAQETYAYGRPLTADTYRTAIDQATSKPVVRGLDENGQRIPSIAQQDSQDGKTKKGDQYKDRNGNPQFQAIRYVLEASSGVQVELHKSILDRLVSSPSEADKDLVRALTSDGKHAPIFTGATNVAIVVEKPEGRSYGTPRLIEA